MKILLSTIIICDFLYNCKLVGYNKKQNIIFRISGNLKKFKKLSINFYKICNLLIKFNKLFNKL